MSLSLVHQEALEKAIDRAYREGIAILTTSGKKNVESRQVPCSYESTICVDAADHRYDRLIWWRGDKVAGGSNWGSIVDVHVPGTLIWSFDIHNDDYTAKNGTSSKLIDFPRDGDSWSLLLTTRVLSGRADGGRYHGYVPQL